MPVPSGTRRKATKKPVKTSQKGTDNLDLWKKRARDAKKKREESEKRIEKFKKKPKPKVAPNGLKKGQRIS